eukprot:3242456-Pleurochrysis_carterae.AAC.1
MRSIEKANQRTLLSKVSAQLATEHAPDTHARVPRMLSCVRSRGRTHAHAHAHAHAGLPPPSRTYTTTTVAHLRFDSRVGARSN